MRVILDENIPRQIETVLVGHSVSTIEREGWKGIQNGALLDRIENAFDVFVTSDGSMLYQNRLVGRNLLMIVLPTNNLTILRANAIAIVETMSDIEKLGFRVAVEIGWRGRRLQHKLDKSGERREMASVPPFAS